MRHGSLICGKAGAFARIWLKFRCSGTSTIGQQMLRLCHEYHDSGTQYRLDWLHAKWDTQICIDRLVITLCAQDSPVHWTILGISSWQIPHGIFTNPIWQSKRTRRYWVLVSEYETCAHLFVAKPQLLLAYHYSSDPHPREFEDETGLRYSWLKCTFCCHGFPGQWLKIMDNWDLQSCPDWASWICMKPTLTSCELLWMYHSSPGTPQERQISHQSACTCST